MRRRPEDMGLHPDGISPSAANVVDHVTVESPTSQVTSVPEPVWNRRDLLTSADFWLLAFCYGIDSFAFQGINVSLAPFIQDLGYGEVTLTAVMTFRAIMMAVTMPLVGFIAEHAHRPIVRVMPFIIQIIGTSLFLLAEQPALLWLSVAVWGIGVSSVSITQEVVWASYFGRLSLGIVRSSGYFVAFGFGAVGPIAINAAFGLLGSYKPAFIALTSLFTIATFVMWLTRPPKPRSYGTAI